MQYQKAQHQNTYGLTFGHMCSDADELLHKIRQAAGNAQLDTSTCIAQTLRDAMSVDEPCPAVVSGDDSHFRVVLINAPAKSVSLIDPFGHGFPEEVKIGIIDLYRRDKSGTRTFTEWGVQLQYDSCNCGIWAMWILQRWMQYWSQDQVATSGSFEAWINPTRSSASIPTAGNLRVHYHDQMQQATAVGTDGKTGIKRSQDMSAARTRNHRDLEELTRIHVNRVYQNMQPHQLTGATQSFHMKQIAPHKRR